MTFLQIIWSLLGLAPDPQRVPFPPEQLWRGAAQSLLACFWIWWLGRRELSLASIAAPIASAGCQLFSAATITVMFMLHFADPSLVRLVPIHHIAMLMHLAAPALCLLSAFDLGLRHYRSARGMIMALGYLVLIYWHVCAFRHHAWFAQMIPEWVTPIPG
jgi:hypothetical protein